MDNCVIRKSLDNLRTEVNRLIDGAFYGDKNLFGLTYPVVEVIESESVIKVRAEIPDVDSENIEILLRNNVLTIKGEKIRESLEPNEKIQRSERFFGQFHRNVSLPDEVDPDKVEARFVKGVLIITLQKQEKVTARKVKISEE